MNLLGGCIRRCEGEREEGKQRGKEDGRVGEKAEIKFI